MQKLCRIMTIDSSLESLIKGQLKFLSDYYEVIAIADDSGKLDSVAVNEGVRTIGVPMRREISILSDLNSLRLLIKVFRKERPYIVHANTPKGSLLSMVAAWITKVPHRIYLVTGLRFETTTGFLRILLKFMERVTCLCATKVIPEGEGVKNLLIRERITRKPLHKILNGNINGIDLNYFVRNEDVVIRSKCLQSDKFTFIYIGRIVKDKGVNELIRSFDRLSKQRDNVRLLLVGAFENNVNPIEEYTRKIIDTNPSIEYAGYQTDVRPYLAASNVLVLPSYREGFPNVIIQAGAMDLPCIVTDINGCNEVVINGKNGIIVPKQNEEALYQAMLTYLEDMEQYKNHASNSRDLIVNRYDQKELWAALLKMYNSL